MWVQLIAGGFLAAEFIYHRWIEKHDSHDSPPREFRIPRTDEGAPVPLIYGRCRIKAPVMAWCRVTNINAATSANIQALFVLGVPFDDGNSTNKVHAMWVGDKRVPNKYNADASHDFTQLSWPGANTVAGYGHIEFLNGNSSQLLVDDSGISQSYAGQAMLASGIPKESIPSFRGFLCAFVHQISSGWLIDTGSALYSFEASSYKSSAGWPAVGVYAQIGQDSNPVNVIYDILKGRLGKLGLPTTMIDLPSFQAAAYKLYTESHGYSRAIEETAQADSVIQEILEQIDATLDDDPTTGLIRIKLIRNDYDPNLIPHITKANCSEIQNLSVGGWDGIINKIRLIWVDRWNDYNEASSIAHNQANAVGQDGVIREKVVRMLGVCERALADDLAGRELSALSRPIIKLRALVDRSFIRVMRGDAVKLTWSDPDIADLIFRVADVDRGLLDHGKIALDLISDSFYVYRGQVPKKPNFSKLDDGTVTLTFG